MPPELQEFAAIFEDMCHRHTDYGTLFCDFCDYWVGGMKLNGDLEVATRLNKKYGEDYKKFNLLVSTMILAYNKKIVDDNSWYDGLGTFYEVIASRYKSSRLGQFFTPHHICDLMTQLQNPVERDTVLDPCSGSGRLLLSAHAYNPKIMCYATDVDPVCAKMSALNMAMHGVRGEVSCMNALSMEWHFGLIINPMFSTDGCPPIPHLQEIECFEYSIFYVNKEALRERALAANGFADRKTVEAKIALEKSDGQLSLF